jgi:hypothetical protein
MALVFKTRQFGISGDGRSGLAVRRAVRGAALGSFIPGVGTAVGAAVGAGSAFLSNKPFELNWIDRKGKTHSRRFESQEAARTRQEKELSKGGRSFRIHKIS